MDVVDLDNIVHKWSLKGHIAKGSMKNKSSLHLQARALIKEIFPTLQILEGPFLRPAVRQSRPPCIPSRPW